MSLRGTWISNESRKNFGSPNDNGFPQYFAYDSQNVSAGYKKF